VNIFDENIPDTQRQLIKSWRIRIYQMGNDVGQKGIKDQEFLYFLLTKHKPVFFTRDLGFYKHHLCQPNKWEQSFASLIKDFTYGNEM